MEVYSGANNLLSRGLLDASTECGLAKRQRGRVLSPNVRFCSCFCRPVEDEPEPSANLHITINELSYSAICVLPDGCLISHDVSINICVLVASGNPSTRGASWRVIDCKQASTNGHALTIGQLMNRDRHSKINILKLFNRVPPKWKWVRSFLSELTFRID